MREVILYIASSIDNRIARADGGIDWLNSPRYKIKGEDYGFARLLKGVDTTLMGYRTFRQVSSLGPLPLAGRTNIVFTRSSRRKGRADIRFITRNIRGFVGTLKRTKGKNIWLIGGSQINTILLNAGLIDRIILTILPVAIGPGIPLFADGTQQGRFRLHQHHSYPNGLVQVTWGKT